MIRRLIYLAAVVSVAGCGLNKQTAPSLAGPASFAVTLAVTASPDVLTQNGSATSFIQVVATDANSQPIANMSVRADTFVGGNQVDLGALSSKSFTTNASGRGTVVYTSPAPPSPSATSDTVVTLAFTPVGQDFANASPRSVDIRLARPTATPSSGDLQALFTFASASPAVGDSISFDASTSKVGVGRSIVSYAWTFSDATVASGKQATHSFNRAGTAVVTMTITDDLGRTAATTQIITIAAALPTASFVISPSSSGVNQQVLFNASTSTAAPGRTIVAYAWDFGDGNTAGSGPTVQHAFNVAQVYTVVLTVTDDVGQHNTAVKTVSIGGAVPTAVFSVTTTSLTTPATYPHTAAVSFTAAASIAPAGRTIASYDWDFGDGTAHGSGLTPSHTYASAGTYIVTLTVTDSSGASGLISIAIVIT